MMNSLYLDATSTAACFAPTVWFKAKVFRKNLNLEKYFLTIEFIEEKKSTENYFGFSLLFGVLSFIVNALQLKIIIIFGLHDLVRHLEF